ncbi:hypothetical protein BGZ83_009723 [Gryganskiella cystojenkinii]|nr:hypothetical protein BGZ83_009723 [Gryganskiella cystojenkinii]
METGIWTLNRSQTQDLANFLAETASAAGAGHTGGAPSTSSSRPKRMQPFHFSRNTTATTLTSAMTPTPSNSSLSFISSHAGSSLTSGIMEQVSTWRTGEDSDDDDEASLEIYSNPRNRSSFPSQESRGDSYGSNDSMLNGIEIQPTLHQLQFPQHPLDQHEDLNVPFQSSSRNDIMPPPSSTSSHRRYSGSSHLQRPNFSSRSQNRLSGQLLQEDNTGDQFVPNAVNSRPQVPAYQALAAEILARGSYPTDLRLLGGAAGVSGGMVAALDNNDQSFVSGSANVSGFPSPLTTAPSPRGQGPNSIFQQQQHQAQQQQHQPFQPQPSHAGSIRGATEPMDTRRTPSGGGSAQSRFSPNHLENLRSRNPSRRSMDGLEGGGGGGDDDNDNMMRRHQRETSRPFVRPGLTNTKDLNDLGRSLQKSLSFNGDDEYQATLRDDPPFARPDGRGQVRHHPYLQRARADNPLPPQRTQHPVRNPARQEAENNFRDRKGKARALGSDHDQQEEDDPTRTPVVLSAINTAQTNILSELMSLQQKSQNDMAHFRQEMYSSLQMAFTKLSDQVMQVGQTVNQAENSQRESVSDLGRNMAEVMSGAIDRMSESLQQQFHHQFERQQQMNQQHQQRFPQSHSPPQQQQQQYPQQQSQQQQQPGIHSFSPTSRSARQGASYSQPFAGPSSSPYPSGSINGGGMAGAGGQDNRRHSANWREYTAPVFDDDDPEDEDADIEAQHNRGKRRAISRPRSAAEVLRPVNRPRRDTGDF